MRLCSGPISLADVAVFVIAHAAETLGAALPERLANLKAWRARVAERPSVATELEEMRAFFSTQTNITAASA